MQKKIYSNKPSCAPVETKQQAVYIMIIIDIDIWGFVQILIKKKKKEKLLSIFLF